MKHVEPETPKKGSKKDLPEWTCLKSGAMRHRTGKWYAAAFLDGWFFYTNPIDKNLGPFRSFELGLRTWKP